MKVKFGRTEIEVTAEDIIMDNGHLYQMISRNLGTVWNKKTPILAKNRAKQMIKEGQLVFWKRENSTLGGTVDYYKFVL